MALRPSRVLATVLSGAALLACLVMLLLPVPWGLKGIVLIGIGACTVYHIRRDARLESPFSITSLEVTVQNGLRAGTRSGAWIDAEVLGSTLVTPQLSVLQLRFPDRYFMRAIVLLPDMLDGEDYRRLRVWLRWGSAIPPSRR